ncbi:O-antigen ligase family protein [Haliangium ochraceum]|uniref:O-antigen polymerase n=1 Tax=Haliangium ochraceum (strain DSM 14365 / JCM 11303 / SMP-2) TaxID=502025 RepID=D0LFN2_HALO1|nr:O-antigen ligase family protein [Haliangium ochraceum]ACY12666.1 O-antigen polymerase [Haliangium ochraceum DSM 14365]
MFTLPGLSALVTFIYLRPQEFVLILQKLPLLYIFFAAALGGLVIDLKLRLIKPIPARTLLIATLFFGWILLNIGVKVPAASKVSEIITFTIVFVTYVLIAQGIQSFRALRVMAWVLLFSFLFLTYTGIRQAHGPMGCLMIENYMARLGTPDGRSCETALDCGGVEAEPGEAYDCQRIGPFGTTALNERVRYRGSLQDPNELSTVICGGVALIIGLVAMSRKLRWRVLAVIGAVAIFMCVIYTQSRGGMLAYMAVIGVYFIRRYGVKYAVIGVLCMLPLMALGGRGGEAASASTEGRYEAWRSGLDMLKMDPVFGVGKGMFTEYHHLTAHNSHVLTFAELGLLGMFLWVSTLYLAFKPSVVALRDFADDPSAGSVRTWALAVLAMGMPLIVQMMFLSLTYHFMTWVWVGMTGGFYSAVKSHVPDWEVKFGLFDIFIIAGIAYGFIAVLPFFLLLKGF